MIVWLLVGGCEDYLAPKPASIMSEYDNEFVWSNPSYAEGVLMSGYQSVPGNFSFRNGEFLAVATNDAVTNDVNSGLRNFSLGQLSPGFNYIDIWSSEYRRIRNINAFLADGLDTRYHSDTVTNAELIQRYRGEAYFLRAYLHWRLLKYYGGQVNGEPRGVPYVTEVLSGDQWQSLERPSYLSCARQIYTDCDSAYKLLPETYTGTDIVTGAKHYGGATSDAAASLKALVSLFAASPAYNSDNEMARWDTALVYTMKALRDVDDRLTSDALADRSFFDPEGPDVIWRGNASRYFGLERNNLPPTLYGSGKTNPSQNLVDAFFMESGYPIEHSASNYNPEFPYLGRGDRFYDYIMYNGSVFNEDTVETHQEGADSYSRDLNGTRTGYFLRKFMSPYVELYPEETGAQYHYYVVLSKTELYFALAEVLNELEGPTGHYPGCPVTAMDVLGKIRKRAGYDPDPYLESQADAGKAAFRELIKHEKRIEMCFEGRRFWDMRRWGDQVDAKPVYGLKVMPEDTLGISFSYDTVKLETRQFQSRYLPLPREDVQLLDHVKQNDGW